MNGETFIMWTTEEGGYFKADRGTREEYEDALSTGILKRPRDWANDEPERIDWFFICFGTVEHNWDKGLGRSRD